MIHFKVKQQGTPFILQPLAEWLVLGGWERLRTTWSQGGRWFSSNRNPPLVAIHGVKICWIEKPSFELALKDPSSDVSADLSGVFHWKVQMESDKLDHDKMLANFHPIPAWFSSCLLNQSCQILSVQAAVSTVQWQVEGRLLEQILQGC